MAKQTPKSTKKFTALNETGRRARNERRVEQAPVAGENRKTQRRRQIDPTTCERDYSEPEIEFMQALDEYKRANGRMFPTCSEILEVFLKLGYRKVVDVVGETSADGMSDPTSLPTGDFMSANTYAATANTIAQSCS